MCPDLNWGLHSLRSGGVTTAANNNVESRALMRHGRWKKVESLAGYADDSTDKKLMVTHNLGL